MIREMSFDPVPDGDLTPVRVPLSITAGRWCVITVVHAGVRHRTRALVTAPQQLRQPLAGLTPARAPGQSAEPGTRRRRRPSMTRWRRASDRHGPHPVRRVRWTLRSTTPTRGFYVGRWARRAGGATSSPARRSGPLFGAVVAAALDRWWAELGAPDPFVVVEAGAGRGALARTVLGRRPACLPALRYVLVEQSAALRARQHGVTW